MSDYDYIPKPEHWTAFAPGMGRTRETAFVVEVDDRAATRQAIIDRLRKRGFTFVERWAWHARQPREILSKKGELETIKDEDIWDYKDIVIHHAGHSYRCAMTSRQSFEEVQRVQDEDMKHFF